MINKLMSNYSSVYIFKFVFGLSCAYFNSMRVFFHIFLLLYIDLHMNNKQLSVKQAEKWLEKLKNENLQSYKDITKFLRKFEKTEDEFDCYVKISHTLLSHSDLTKELNLYMEEGNKFIVNKPEEEKIKDFMGYVKKSRPDIFDEIIKLIQDLSKNKIQNSPEMNKNLKPRLKEIIKGDIELERITQETLDLTAEELISRRSMEHLKVPKVQHFVAQEPVETSKPQPSGRMQENNAGTRRQAEPKPTEIKIANRPVTNFTMPSQQRNLMRSLEKITDEETYNYIIKIIKIYYLNIITRNEAFDLLAHVNTEENHLEGLKDILDARETQRRKLSVFRPLNDMNFSNYQRASPSYVSVPPYYPIISSGKTALISSLTNNIWVSVPYGSQESENFSVRNKNSNEINLLKAQDERYQFDIYMKRLQKTNSLLDKYFDDKVSRTPKEKENLINQIISMGVLQLIYKNCHRDQKEQVQWYLKVNQIETLKLFKDRISTQITELKGIKEIHANKNWNEVASKNFYKALDLKGFQFKKNEKQKMKGNFFINELNERSKILENGGQCKNMMIAFEDKKEFFSILNSFSSSSRTEKCISRKLPPVELFDLKDEQRRHFYPLMILALEDVDTCNHIYSLILFYIESAQIAENQKIRCKIFLEQFLVGILGWKIPTKKCLTQLFDQEKLFNKISKTSEQNINIRQWITQQYEISYLNSSQKMEGQDIKMQFLNDKLSDYSYLPTKSQNKIVIYGSQHLYALTRFIYALYERIIKMKQVSENEENIILFEILFYSCIKAKQGIKFQQNLNLLFGKHAYLFSTLYKLFDNLLKSLSNASLCLLTNYSFKNYNLSSQEIYFLLLNKYCLSNNLINNKILRLTYNKEQKVLYFNYLQSYYKSQDIGKDINKKRLDINKGIEIYTVDSFGIESKKRRKPNDLFQNNELQYIFQGNTIKMLNHCPKQDLMFYENKKLNYNKAIKRQLKRAHKLASRIN